MPIKYKKIYNTVKLFFRNLSDKNVSVYASSSAFYIFLSVVPFIMLAGSLLPVSRLDNREFAEFIKILVPETVADFLNSIINEVYIYSPAILSISAAATLWSSSKAMASIMRGIEHVNYGSTKDRYIRLRLRAILYSVTVLLAIYVLIMATVFISLFTGLKFLSLNLIRITSPFILTLILTAAYKFIPDKHISFRQLIPGACAAAACWTIFTAGYSLWLKFSDSYGIYGSLASVVITLLWMYISMYIMLSGAYFNKFLYEFKRKRPW